MQKRRFRMQYLQQIKKDYIRARKKVKGQMLQEAMKICQLSSFYGIS
ncbi:MAG: hypothetical protein LBV16_02040 [Elusimicrobiota bacterium]|jgi:hypothetical protein|nr:hypothetical protein [Elusimicrobiota bacterium]